MFRDSAQRSRVFGRLLESGMLPEGFGAAGPAPQDAAPRDASQQRLQRVALALWHGEGSLPISDVFALEAPLQEAIGSLLMAIGLGHAAIDRWLEESTASGT